MLLAGKIENYSGFRLPLAVGATRMNTFYCGCPDRPKGKEGDDRLKSVHY